MVDAVLVSRREVSHVLGGREYDLAPAVQRLACRTEPVLQFGEEDGVRLLPVQDEAAHPRRRSPLRSYLLAPLRAPVLELLGELPCHGEEPLVALQRIGGHGPAIPQAVVGQVPPDHLHVELASPGIEAQQTRLRGGPGAGRVGGHLVLREDDAPFQLHPPGIRAAREVYGSPRTPEGLPPRGRRSAGLIEAGEPGEGLLREPNDHLERRVGAAHEREGVLPPVRAPLGPAAR